MGNEYAQYRTEQELLNCGFSQESLHSIKDTNTTAESRIMSSAHQQNDKQQDPANIEHTMLVKQLDDQQKLFARFKQYTDGRIMTLERGLSAAQEVIKDMHTKITTLQSNSHAQARQATGAKQENKPADKAIDRNNIAPAQVQVDKIFYCGER